MTLKKSLIALVALGSLALAGVVHSQVNAPQVSTLNQTDLFQVIPRGQPSAQGQFAVLPKITNVYGYYKASTSVSTSGFTYSFGSNVTYAAFDASGTSTYGYFTLATAPSDGSLNCIFSTAAVTFTYVCSASTGKGNCTTTSVNDGITTLAANGRACYLYSASNTAWDRVQ